MVYGKIFLFYVLTNIIEYKYNKIYDIYIYKKIFSPKKLS